MKIIHDSNLIVGIEGSDDAGVYKLSDDLAIIQTVDFFTPIVDDPYMFGQIAAANALSDVYAMGGRPLTAMNMVCFPIKKMDIDVLRQIMRGGIDKLGEAETTLVGGHSVEDNELKYGFSITGRVHPDNVITNTGVKNGDLLVLTKPLGTGIINTAIKGGLASDEAIAKVSASMASLNKNASLVMQNVGVDACTDITGFGLLGHAHEMIGADDIGMIFHARSVPLLPEVQEYAEMGLVPGGTGRNKKFSQPWVRQPIDIPPYLLDVLYDPQTSGGLLISVAKNKIDDFIEELKKNQVPTAAIVGEVVSQPKGKIIIVN